MSKFKLIIKSKYFIPLIIVILNLGIFSPCVFNALLAKEEDLMNILNEYGIHYYTMFIVFVSILWTFFVYCLLKLCSKIEKYLKEKKDE